MKSMSKIATALVLATTAFTGQTANAASQNECAIWICLPGGFPSGCGAAYSAMISRIKHRKPPLPDFDSCAVNPPSGSGSHMSYKQGYAAHIPAHQECTENWWGQQTCTDVPEKYIEGTMCNNYDGYMDPAYCSNTVQWIKVYTDGNQAGNTYYW
jgi:hypothetical protein